MERLRRSSRDDPFVDETLQQIGDRAAGGLVFFVVCVVLSTGFEIARFPERRPWMLSFAAAFLVASVLCWLTLRRYAARRVEILIVFVNVIGVALNAYHAIVGASVAMCLWTLTGLLASTAVFLRWGAGNQAVASVGTLLSYPLHLMMGNVDVLIWSAGGTYLAFMSAMSVFGSELYARYLRSGLQLSRTLSEREARLQSYFDLAPVGTAVLAPDGRFTEVNDALCRVLGYSRDELLARAWLDLLDPDGREIMETQMTGALSGAAPGRLSEAQLVRKDGVTIDAAIDVRGLPGSRGTIDHVMVLVQDVTDRKRADTEREQRLAAELDARRNAEAASRAKDDFLAMVSHELRTPLSPILAWSDLLRRRRLGPEQTDRGLAAIARNAAAQARLVDELLDVSRIVSGKLRLELHPIDFAPVVLEAVEVIRHAADAKGVDLHVHIEPATYHVVGDADRLRQVVWNLLSNAVKFTPRGGRVHVTVRRPDGYVRLTVADSGQGIPAEFLPVVFDRFRQVDTSSTRTHGGLGIGLAIVRELVELHGGRVTAESPGDGRGAVFTVDLPLLADARAVDATRVQRTDQVTLDGLRILVVDDDADSNEVVRTVVASCGAEVRTAGSAQEALEILDRWLPDVLVSDLAMPDEDGYTLLAHMRARGRKFDRVTTIALTAYSAPADREQALSAGFHAHVAKPLQTAELLGAIAAARETGARLH